LKKSNTTPHDRFTRAALSDQRVAKDFFETHLPPAVLKQIDLTSLALTKESFVDEQLQLSITDMLFTVRYGEQVGYIYLLVEAQSKAEWWMPVRLLKYMLDIMEHHGRITREKRLPIIYPLVLYNGKKVYNQPTDILEMFAESDKALAQTILLKPFQLIDLTTISDEALRGQIWLQILEGCLKHIHDRDILPFVRGLVSVLRQAEQANGESLVQAVLRYIITAGEMSNKQVFLDIIERGLSSTTRETVMTMAQEIERKGWQQGMQEGIQRGVQQGMQQGMQQGEYSLLLRQLERKFKQIPEIYYQKLIKADVNTLLMWGEHLIEAQTIEEIFSIIPTEK
jgi:predicted transposase/invertase (TIGR01784 family)